jgi:hypothetical protein
MGKKMVRVRVNKVVEVNSVRVRRVLVTVKVVKKPSMVVVTVVIVSKKRKLVNTEVVVLLSTKVLVRVEMVTDIKLEVNVEVTVNEVVVVLVVRDTIVRVVNDTTISSTNSVEYTVNGSNVRDGVMGGGQAVSVAATACRSLQNCASTAGNQKLIANTPKINASREMGGT